MKCKKMIALVSALCMLGAVSFLPESIQESAVISAKSADKTYQNLTYFVNYDNTIMITGYVKDINGELIIPDKINDMPVTIIETNAFSQCSMTTVVLPETITEIGSYAFHDCENLVSINFPETVTEINSYAFYNCSNLTSAVIPKNTTKIEYLAFGNCSSLASVTVKNKDCEIDSFQAESWDNGYYSTSLGIDGRTVIIGYEDSTAQAHAELWGFKFVPLSEEPEVLLGDADNSGSIDILDVITLNKAILGKEELSESQLKAIDFNGNGKPDSEESLKIMKYIVGLITSFTE